MYDFEKIFGGSYDGCAPEKYEIIGDIRICIITDSLIRIEKQSDGKFCDLPTQAVVCRSFASPAYTVQSDESSFIIKTETTQFIFRGGELSCVILQDGRAVTDFTKGNLKGTRRTLDMTFGSVKIGDGIISRNGVAFIDDSASLILIPDGTIQPRAQVLGRTQNGTDRYCFAYGNDYTGAIRDYYRLTGMTPLIPRFALGNWWSRYKAYTQEEYSELMERFREEKIPITVATVDMDWHYTDVADRFGKDAVKCNQPKDLITKITGNYLVPGWTGYTWNEELFPDYKAFLSELHKYNYKVTLNLHPAQGVRPYETGYREFAEFMGIEDSSPIPFDITDPKFIEGYFRFMHHPYEESGVDFWWLDWQQERTTKIEGLDPLWALNHYHSLDLNRDGTKRPLTLSRFAGCGSHRYPLGFSGDTGTNFASLKFQPYFTATASNIGYSWWSHDIGGHHFGVRSDELYIRWVQFGVFSPIMRLHSSKNEFTSKEPWKYSGETQRIVTDFMRLRHRLIPYIYTMNRRTNKDGIPLIRPMYHEYPSCDEAYNVPNEYLFGSELIVCPITEKCNKTLRQGGTDVWLPEGRYTDIFTGIVYTGGRKMRMYRDLCSIPVLARQGAIIPLSENGTDNSWANPDSMELLIFSGDGEFKLYEDDGETEEYKNGHCAETLFSVKQSDESLTFTINPTQGNTSLIPEERSYTLRFINIKRATVNGVDCDRRKDGCLCIKLKGISADEKIELTLTDIEERKNPPRSELLTQLISRLQGLNDLKTLRYSRCLKPDFNGKLVAKKAVREAVNEIMNIE